MVTYNLSQLIDQGIITLGRGKVISKNELSECVGDYPVYSSSATENGEFGRYGKYMFDDERITWSIDGGGRFFHRIKHKYSVTNVCGWLLVNKPDLLNTKYLYYCLTYQWKFLTFDYTYKAHPSKIKDMYYVSIPPIDIQEQIVNELEGIESIILKNSNSIPLYDELIKSRFIEMFGDPIDNNYNFPKGIIGDYIVDVRYGTSKPAKDGGNYQYLRMNNLTYDGYLDYENVKYIDATDEDID